MFGYACDRCREKHQSCNHEVPCNRCIKAGVSEFCHFTPKRLRFKPVSATSSPTPPISPRRRMGKRSENQINTLFGVEPILLKEHEKYNFNYNNIISENTQKSEEEGKNYNQPPYPSHFPVLYQAYDPITKRVFLTPFKPSIPQYPPFNQPTNTSYIPADTMHISYTYPTSADFNTPQNYHHTNPSNLSPSNHYPYSLFETQPGVTNNASMPSQPLLQSLDFTLNQQYSSMLSHIKEQDFEHLYNSHKRNKLGNTQAINATQSIIHSALERSSISKQEILATGLLVQEYLRDSISKFNGTDNNTSANNVIINSTHNDDSHQKDSSVNTNRPGEETESDNG